MELEKKKFMLEAIRLSMEKMKEGLGGPFGAVVVKEGKIVGRGYNQVTSLNDPSAHAEILAIRDACKNLNTYHLKGCELYTSCEPCPMCMGAVYWARLEKVYYGNSNQDAEAAGFIDKFILDEFCLPPEKRSIDMHQLMNTEAKEAFIRWNVKHDKKEY